MKKLTLILIAMLAGCNAVDAQEQGCDAVEADLDAAYTAQYDAEQETARSVETIEKLTVQTVTDTERIVALELQVAELLRYSGLLTTDNEIAHSDADAAVELAAEQLAGCTDRNADLMRVVQSVPIDFINCAIAPWVCESAGISGGLE
jgi:hypothetical protein